MGFGKDAVRVAPPLAHAQKEKGAPGPEDAGPSGLRPPSGTGPAAGRGYAPALSDTRRGRGQGTESVSPAPPPPGPQAQPRSRC